MTHFILSPLDQMEGFKYVSYSFMQNFSYIDNTAIKIGMATYMILIKLNIFCAVAMLS
jgi:hypothetical protein